MKNLFVFLIFINFNYALGTEYKWKKYSFELETPSNWVAVKDLFNLPYSFLSPKHKHGARSVIQIIPSKSSKFNLNEKSAANFDKRFRASRLAFLKKNKGELVLYRPMKQVQLGSEKAFMAEHKYKYGNGFNYHEKTYYLYCGKKLFNIKSHVRILNGKLMGVNDRILESFKCN